MPLPVYKVGYKVMAPLTLPLLPAPLRSWGAAARAAAGGLQLGALQYAGAPGKGPRLCPEVAAAAPGCPADVAWGEGRGGDCA